MPTLHSTSCMYLAHHELESLVVIIIIIIVIIISIIIIIIIVIVYFSSTCECASCRTRLKMPSAAAAQGLLPGQVPGQAGAPAQQLPAQQATTRQTAACHLPLMRRTAISCCCWMLLRSCTRLPLMTALSPQLLLPMVCTVMTCVSFSYFRCTSAEDPCDKR